MQLLEMFRPVNHIHYPCMQPMKYALDISIGQPLPLPMQVRLEGILCFDLDSYTERKVLVRVAYQGSVIVVDSETRLCSPVQYGGMVIDEYGHPKQINIEIALIGTNTRS